MIKTVTHKILKISAAISLIAQTILSPLPLIAAKQKPVKTTENIYGNHVLEISDKDKAARRLAVKKAMKLQITKN